MTLVPGVSLADVGAMTVTVTPAGTVMVCEPPLYATVMVPFAAPLFVPLVIRAAPLVMRAAPFVIRELATLPFVMVLRAPVDSGAIGRLPSPSPRSSSGKT